MFGDVVRARRLECGLTQAELAKRAAVGVRTIRNIEAGKVRHYRQSTVRLLAAALELGDASREAFLRSAFGPPTDPATATPGVRPDRWGVVVPRQLPGDVSAFTGRLDELGQLDAMLAADDGESERNGIVISVLCGAPGIGKTALALHWAHRAAGRFPDGHLYVNLRGYDQAEPMPATEALAGFLLALGVAPGDIPLDSEVRAARYRTEVAGRRLLITLDNAASVAQVRPLLPGSTSCAVLVTSRDSLAGLIAVHGGHRLDLDLLPAADAVTLLRRLIGARVDAEPDAAATLAAQCARLPLALRVAAELAASRPAERLADLTGQLADQQRRLEMLCADADSDAGADVHANVMAVFSWSYRHLSAGAARAFRLLGLHPGADFDAYSVAALAGTDLREGNGHLKALARAHLIRPAAAGRYAMHDLLRAYAIRRADADEPADERRGAQLRLFDFYLCAVAAAMDTLHPAESHHRPRMPSIITPLPDLAATDRARAWLDGERPTLVAVARSLATLGCADHAVRLSTSLFRYLASGHPTDAVLIHEHARRAAHAAGDCAGEGRALLGLVDAHLQSGQVRLARQLAWMALDLSHRANDRRSEARARYSLGMIDWKRARYSRALTHAEASLALADQAGDATYQAKAHTLVGLVAFDRGETGRAAACFEQSLLLYQNGNGPGLAYTLHNLGCVELRLRHPSRAADLQTRSVTLFQHLGDRAGEALALVGLASAYADLGRLDTARRTANRALAMAREMGDRRTEPAALNSLGDIAYASGQYGQAIVHHTAARTLSADTDLSMEQAHADHGLGRAHLAMGHEMWPNTAAHESPYHRSNL